MDGLLVEGNIYSNQELNESVEFSYFWFGF